MAPRREELRAPEKAVLSRPPTCPPLPPLPPRPGSSSAQQVIAFGPGRTVKPARRDTSSPDGGRRTATASNDRQLAASWTVSSRCRYPLAGHANTTKPPAAWVDHVTRELIMWTLLREAVVAGVACSCYAYKVVEAKRHPAHVKVSEHNKIG